MNEYIKVFKTEENSKVGIIMLPDIWGMTEYSQQTAKEFAGQLGMSVYMLDYFYQLTGKPSDFNLQADQSLAVGLMDKMTGEDFVEIFNEAIQEIRLAQPDLESFVVIGFCFGGRLAYLSGISPMVKKIVSFYGAGAHTSNYLEGKTPVEVLCENRNGDKSLRMLSFYGSADSSISASDRELTEKSMADASIDYTEKIYEAGHAYFQPGRTDNYNAAASSASWDDLKSFIKT